MSRVLNIKYDVDETSFELKPKVIFQSVIKEPFVVNVDIPEEPRLSTTGLYHKLVFDFQRSSELKIRVSSELGEIHIKIQKPGYWRRFLESNFSQFIGLLSAAFIHLGKEDFLWIEPSSNLKVWIIGIVWDSDKRYWNGMLAQCKRLTNLDVDFWLIATGQKKRKLAARRLFNSLTEKEGLSLPNNFPFCSYNLTSSKPRCRQLTIKINPSELWFLSFPIDHFCRFKYGGFSPYKEVEWIITADKTFVQNIYERIQIRNELRDIRNFLKHSVIILNTYQFFDKEPIVKEKWREGTELVKEILSLFQDIKVDEEILSLRWHLNPGKGKVSSELLDSKTWYFFGDFHTENGKWQCGKDEWMSFDSFQKGTLYHIRLMRVFHCHSIGKIDVCGIHPSVVPSLLSAGAMRAEGSIMEENYLDYLCSLLSLSIQTQGLRPVLLGKCLEKKIDFNNIIKRTESFLETCGWNITA
ncbi:MAG: hypothetical protein ACFFCW_20850 [Candidatus Hodarchaeota archaeon]